MRDQQFDYWLRDKYPNPNTWRTYLSETRRIAKHIGDLDEVYETDRFQDLLDSFRCSKINSIPPTDAIPHEGDPYTTANFRQQCLKLYSQFYNEYPREGAACLLPDEAAKLPKHLEGSLRRVVVNRYERNWSARNKCIQFHGTSCVVCGLDFEATYGNIGNGFIHVHHLKEISSVGKEYILDPVEDLRPVCPTCHAMIHKKVPAYSIKEIKECLEG